MAATDPTDPTRSWIESRDTARGILGLLGLQVALAGWWCGFVLPGRSPSGLLDPDEVGGPQTATVLVIMCLVNLVVLIFAVTQVEKAAERRILMQKRRWWVRLGGLLVIADLIASVVALVLARWPGSSRTTVGLLLCVVVLGALAGLFSAEPAWGNPPPESDAKLSYQLEQTRATPLSGVTMAMSGGGIRAAAFTLGAYQSLAEPSRNHVVTDDEEPRLVAVSGGSYLAASLALVRNWLAEDTTGSSRKRSLRREDGTVLDWREAYALTSGETVRLRRHTRDLVEPLHFVIGGLLTLLFGAALNPLIVLGLVRLIAWILAWLYATSGILVVDEDTLVLVSPFLGQRHDAVWSVVTGGSLGLLLVFVLISLGVYGAQRRTEQLDRKPERWRRWVALRVWVAGLLLGWVIVLMLVPLSMYGLSHAAVENRPSSTIAGAVTTLGFATEAMCKASGRASVQDAHQQASARAILNPGSPQTVTAGACGGSVSVSAEYPAPTGTETGESERAGAYQTASTWRATGEHVPLAAKVAAWATLFSAAGVALRAAGGRSDVALTGWRARLRRLLLAWLPLGVAILLLTWFFLATTFTLTIDPSELSRMDPALWVVTGLLVAAWLDANTTSLHSFYRQRLSSAFAVGRVAGSNGEQDDRIAGPLHYEDLFRFSQLRKPDLHVVTTANVRAYDQVPTRRGGLPLVLSTNNVRLATAHGSVVKEISAYEKAAGRGRVSIMSAVATSGAAVSPMAGRFSSSVAPFRILLTVFNVRVGSWTLNPAWVGSIPVPRPRGFLGIIVRWPWTPWITARPGAVQVLLEAVGQSSADDRWLYLSDGGHLDNTGLVEAVRLHAVGQGYAGRILVVDASNDALGSWAAVGDAMSVVRAEFGVELECVLGRRSTPQTESPGVVDRPPVETWGQLTRGALKKFAFSDSVPSPPQQFMRLYRGCGPHQKLEVMVVKAVRPKSLDELPKAVASFAHVHPQFPRASTTRQDFGDLEFEAYRALGEHYSDRALSEWSRWIELNSQRPVTPTEVGGG